MRGRACVWLAGSAVAAPGAFIAAYACMYARRRPSTGFDIFSSPAPWPGSTWVDSPTADRWLHRILRPAYLFHRRIGGAQHASERSQGVTIDAGPWDREAR